MASFFDNLFLSVENWIVVYVALSLFWFWIASWKNEKAKYVAWAGLLIGTVIFITGLLFPEVRQYFHVLLRR